MSQELDHNLAVEWYMDFLTGELPEEKLKVLQSYLDAHEELRQELKADETLWAQLGKIRTPEPSSSMDSRFEATLAGYKAGAQRTQKISIQLPDWLVINWRAGLSFAVVGLIIGFFVFNKPGRDSELSTLANEVQDMKKVMMFTLIEQPGAQERIKAVSMARGLDHVDQKVIEALGKTLRSDPNVNVRIAAIDALQGYWNQAGARETMVESIAFQTSPLVQSAIADAMLTLGEKQAIAEFEKLMRDQQINEAVVPKIESTIDQLKSI